MSRANTKADVATRQLRVAQMLESGLTLTEIAKELEVSKATISSDFKSILKEWQDERLTTTGAYLQLELARLERIHNSLWLRVCRGELGAIDRSLKVMERRAKLLGLDAPTKVDGRFTDMTDAELAEWLASQGIQVDGLREAS